MNNTLNISEDRFNQLISREKESMENFESICVHYTKLFLRINRNFNRYGDKTMIADFVNMKIKQTGILFNDRLPSVWFNCQGSGSMLYWSFRDSKTIEGIESVLDEYHKKRSNLK